MVPYITVSYGTILIPSFPNKGALCLPLSYLFQRPLLPLVPSLIEFWLATHADYKKVNKVRHCPLGSGCHPPQRHGAVQPPAQHRAALWLGRPQHSRRRGKAAQVEHIRLTPGLKVTWVQRVESTSLSMFWLQIVNLHPYTVAAQAAAAMAQLEQGKAVQVDSRLTLG